MRKSLVITLGLVTLAFAGVALAASYKTGKYKAGSAQGDGVTLRVAKGKFSVKRISFMETCTSSSDSFSERFTFLEGSAAKLSGAIDGKGRFSGRYESSAGVVNVKGTVKGSKATVKGSEHGSFYPSSSGEQYNCQGSHTFFAKRAK